MSLAKLNPRLSVPDFQSKQMVEIRKKLDDLRNRIIEKEKEIKMKDDEIDKLNKKLKKK